jgi:HD domain
MYWTFVLGRRIYYCLKAVPWLRWLCSSPSHGLPLMNLTPTDGTGRLRSAYTASMLALIALVPAFLLLAPASHWDDPVTLIALGAIGLVSYGSMVWMRPVVFLDGEFVAVLLAIALLGPLPGLCVWLGSELAYFLLDRHRLEAHLANVASYGWATLAGGLTLSWLGTSSFSGPLTYVALAIGAVVMLCVNFIVTRGIVAVILDGQFLRATIREELLRPAAATLTMVAIGVLTAFLYTRIGILALALFTVVVLVPQTVLPLLLRPRPMGELKPSQAAAKYAMALAQAMKLDRGQRLVLQDASTFLRDDPDVVSQGQLSSIDSGHCLEVKEAVLYVREHWDGPDGFPGAVGGEMIPLASRILAVSVAWARLTAAGSPGLSHSQALTQLESRAGLHFDPQVVAAVARIVENDRLGLASDTAYQPRIHRVRLPEPVARLGALVGEAA